MTDFHEVRFPDDISKGSSGGPTRRTDIVELVSGHEKRNAAQANSKRMYDAGMGIRDIDDLHDVIEFWEARFGQLYGFRWKDWSDYKSGRGKAVPAFDDQTIGTGDGSTTAFQLVKNYNSGGFGYSRQIRKPVTGTVLIGLAGVAQSSGWTLDSATGIVTFSSAPGVGQTVTAGYEFDVPARFDAEQLFISIEAFNAGSVPQITVKEIRV